MGHGEPAAPLRVVIDTNVLIAALTRPRGNAARVVQAWLDGRVEVVTSEATIREAELVLSGGWLGRLSSEAEVSRLVERLRERSVRVKARPIAGIGLKDEGDRNLVEAAAAGDARYVVTNDREVLMRRGHGGTEFVTPAEMLRILKGDSQKEE